MSNPRFKVTSMSKVEVTYTGDMQCSALNTRNAKSVSENCGFASWKR